MLLCLFQCMSPYAILLLCLFMSPAKLNLLPINLLPLSLGSLYLLSCASIFLCRSLKKFLLSALLCTSEGWSQYAQGVLWSGVVIPTRLRISQRRFENNSVCLSIVCLIAVFLQMWIARSIQCGIASFKVYWFQSVSAGGHLHHDSLWRIIVKYSWFCSL